MLFFKCALVIIFEGPSGPKLRTEALVASENVGDDGREFSRLGDSACERRERARGMLITLVACDSVEKRNGGDQVEMW